MRADKERAPRRAPFTIFLRASNYFGLTTSGFAMTAFGATGFGSM